MPSRPSVYSLLVSDPNDTLAALAYTTYKQHEVETFAEIALRTGHPPTPDDIEAFERTASTPSALAMYERQAEALMKTFLEITLSARQAKLDADFLNTAVGQKLATLQAQQDAKKGFGGWFRDVSANLTVNVMTLLVIAALVYGYRLLDGWMSDLGTKTGVIRSDQTPVGPLTAPAGSAPAAAGVPTTGPGAPTQ